MKVSKRDFLKMLGAGGSVAAISHATPRDPSAHPETLPEQWEPDQTKQVITQEEAYQRTGERWNPHGAMFRGIDVFDAVDGMLYDRIHFKAGATLPERLLFFSTPAGQICPYTGEVRTNGDTNMHGAQILHPPSCYWVQKIHIVVNPDIADADFKRAKEYAWALWLINKRYAGGPLFMDLQKASWRDMLRRKVKPTRSSLEFANMKGLYIPSLANFYSDMTTKHGRQEMEWDRNGHPRLVGTPPLRLQMDGNGLDLAIGLEGIEFRGVQ